jgi:hypothetical protein
MKYIKLFEAFIDEEYLTEKKAVEKWAKKKKLINEAVSSKIGPKASKFDSIIDEWNWFTDADSTDESLPKEYHTGLKKLGVKANDAIVVFSGVVGSWGDILSAAKKAQIKYVEVDDEETGESAIIFDGTK